MQARPIRKAALASSVGVSILLSIGGCAEYIKPSPYAVSLKEVAPSDVAHGCPPIESEWWAATNAHGKLRNKPHPGIDIHLPRGTPILASAPGRVLLVDATSDGGRFVAIHHGADESGNHIYTTYWHLDTFDVRAGEEVERGQQIATMGATGTDAGGWDNYHLHMVPLVGPPPPEFEGGKLSLLQFAAYSDLIVNPRFLWYPYAANNTPPSAGRAQRYDPSKSYGDRPGLFTGLTYPVRCT